MLLTIGHGNRAIGEFVALLGDAGVECLVDVRAYPASRRNPQFTRAALEASLAVEHIVPPGAAAGHALNPAARLDSGALIYDAGRQLGLL